uniref:Uncharacterized protein n=1 Tax=Anguilla anguilla TaxID=7936 RepID=A0A0E9S641_ANGAN
MKRDTRRSERCSSPAVG